MRLLYATGGRRVVVGDPTVREGASGWFAPSLTVGSPCLIRRLATRFLRNLLDRDLQNPAVDPLRGDVRRGEEQPPEAVVERAEQGRLHRPFALVEQLVLAQERVGGQF